MKLGRIAIGSAILYGLWRWRQSQDMSPPGPSSQAINPTPESSEPIQADADAQARLDSPEIRAKLSPELNATLDLAPPDNLPFNKLSAEAQSVLLRGFAADYVAAKALDEAPYAAAVAASTNTGLPIGWTQLLVLRGVSVDALDATALRLLEAFEPALRAAVEQAKGAPLDLVGLKRSLMDRFAPLPAGVYMPDEVAGA